MELIKINEIEKKLKSIILDEELVKKNLEGMNSLIEEAVGDHGSAWRGEAATSFRKSWDVLADDIPSFIDTVKIQATNLETLLQELKKTENS